MTSRPRPRRAAAPSDPSTAANRTTFYRVFTEFFFCLFVLIGFPFDFGSWSAGDVSASEAVGGGGGGGVGGGVGAWEASQTSLDAASDPSLVDGAAGGGGFSRDQFGRQSMSEKRHAALDAKNTDTYQRNKKLRSELGAIVFCFGPLPVATTASGVETRSPEDVQSATENREQHLQSIFRPTIDT